MAPRSSSQSSAKGGTWKGIMLLLFLIFVSVLTVNIGPRTVSFVFLPLIGICLWPRTERPIVSILAIAIFGLFLDLLSAGPLGLWPLIFLTVFAVFRPHLRLKPHSFKTALTVWLAVLGLAVIASYFLGWFALESRPDILTLLLQALMAMILFPFIYGLRHLGKHLLSDPDMRGL